MCPGARGGGPYDAGLFAGLNVSVQSEIEGRFSEMDASQKALQQQLHSIQMQLSSEVSWSVCRFHLPPGIAQMLTAHVYARQWFWPAVTLVVGRAGLALGACEASAGARRADC